MRILKQNHSNRTQASLSARHTLPLPRDMAASGILTHFIEITDSFEDTRTYVDQVIGPQGTAIACACGKSFKHISEWHQHRVRHGLPEQETPRPTKWSIALGVELLPDDHCRVETNFEEGRRAA